MYKTKATLRLLSAVSVLMLVGLFSSEAFARGPSLKLDSGRIATAKEKQALRVFEMRGGYKGDVEAKRLGDRLLRHARFSDELELKADETNHLIHIGRNDPSSHFRVNKITGDFSFRKGMEGYFNDRATRGLPGKEEAVTIAKKHLTDLGVMPEDQREMVVRHVGGLRQVDISEDGTMREFDKLVTVHFGRKIGGVDVGGPGSKIVVDLGTNGELVALTKRWIDVREERKVKRDFGGRRFVKKSVKKKLKLEANKASRIDVSIPDFGYYDDGEGNIEPAYFFEAELSYDLQGLQRGEKRHLENYNGVVPALKRPKARFDKLDRAKAQPQRSKAVERDRPPIED